MVHTRLSVVAENCNGTSDSVPTVAVDRVSVVPLMALTVVPDATPDPLTRMPTATLAPLPSVTAVDPAAAVPVCTNGRNVRVPSFAWKVTVPEVVGWQGGG